MYINTNTLAIRLHLEHQINPIHDTHCKDETPKKGIMIQSITKMTHKNCLNDNSRFHHTVQNNIIITFKYSCKGYSLEIHNRDGQNMALLN